MPPSLLVPMLGAALAGLATPAVPGQHDPPVPTNTAVVRTVVRTVEVAPAHDWMAEAMRLGVAVALAGAAGAVIGTRRTAIRLRHRAPAPKAGLIDITDVVQSPRIPDEIQFGRPVKRRAGSR